MRQWFGQLTRNERYRRRLLDTSGPADLTLDPNTHTVTLGDAGDGNNYGFSSGSYGAIDPTTADATTIAGFTVFIEILRLNFVGNAAPQGTGGTYTVTLGGDDGGPYVLTWSGFAQSYQFDTNSSALLDLMAANVGRDMEVNIVGAP